jgi:hypothetical protein
MSACSAIVNPDEGRLGGGSDAGTDTGTMTGDSSVPPGDADTGVPPSDTSVPPVDTGVPPGCEFDRRCDGDDLLICDAGDVMRVPCRLGCSEASGTATCGNMIPSNVDSDLWMESAEDLEVEGHLSLNTSECDSDAVITTVVPQTDAPELCVISVAAFRIREGAAMSVFGSRPLVVMATDEVRIDGILDLSATGGESGPGGFRGGTGGGAVELWNGGGPFGGGVGGHEGAFDDGGGGGGGFCGGGGDGGDGGFGGRASGGTGGATVMPAWQLSPLFGGSGGGRGRGAFGSSGSNAGFGGAGGGALQISTPTRIRLGGRILAGGGGGLPGRNLFGSTQNWGSGGGGGSGGAVLLEAPEVSFDGGAVVAAGGGGGGGGGASDGEAGEDGRAAGLGRARGGAGDDVRGANGGNGSASTNPAGRNGSDNLTDNGNGGGGGGGAGCVLVRTLDATVGGTIRAHPAEEPGYRQLRVLTP